MEKKKRHDLKAELLPYMEKFMTTGPRLKKETCQGHRKVLLSFITYVDRSQGKKCFPEMMRKEIIIGWLKNMRARYSLDTVEWQGGTVTRFLSFLEKNGYLDTNPLAHLKEQYPRKGLKGIILALLSSSPKKSFQNLKLVPRFASPLGPYMERFLTLGRSQGKIYGAEEQILCRFDRFLSSYSEPPNQLSDSIMKGWVGLLSKCKPSYRYQSFMVVRRFCLYLRRFDPQAYLPDSLLSPLPPPPYLPHIYSRAEIVALVKASGRLKPSTWSPLRPQTFRVLIFLLYTTGLRLSEALKLRLGDIDQKDQTIYIRRTKFFKSRLVPLSPSMMRELEEYLQLRRRSGAPVGSESLLFKNPHGEGPYWHSSIELPFRRMVQDLGLKSRQGKDDPRLHDLRATFAVHRLEQWYRQGVDLQSKLGLLSTFMGHVGPASTQKYLPMTTELLQYASKRFEKYFTSTQTGGEKQ